ncbi:endonuclease subunit [uncultured Caudovirales phage]|uniref:Endonuclease subunit n=1 Tax=uncultured Caudovirales phage TaxID=2100421 RepID=A0A6J5L7F3_9CAUD|nr:endonuclease subunit [uncultured Caudovirales phage]
MNLFKKVAVFTDLHLGLKSNSEIHNKDCEDFVDWFIATAKAQGCETGMFLGDWHNHRASISLQTLHYSLRCLEKLSKAFERFYFIPGNHDLYFKDKRDIHGAEWAKHIPNIIVVNDWMVQDNIVIAPWLVGDDHKRIPKLKGQYLFGHLELPHFKMNALVEMPDHGELQHQHFSQFDRVFSGHFHLRQHKNNITYIGNAFPHNFSDAGDDNRGCMIMQWGSEPEYFSWPGQPKFRVHTLSELLEVNQTLLQPNMHVKVHIDIDISYEEANFIKETFVKNHTLREMSLIPLKHQSVAQDLAPGDVKFESVDQIINHQIANIDSEFYDRNLLLKIYQTL